MTKRILSALLASLLAATSLAACAGDTPEDTTAADTTTAAPETTTEETTTEDPRLIDELPTDKKFDGYDFVVVTPQYAASAVAWVVQDIYTEEENGERINDAVYQRNLMLNERFGINVKQGDYGTSPISALQQLISAGDDSFALIQERYQGTANMAIGGYLLNMNNVEYINTDKAWWDSSAVQTLNVDGRLYFAPGAGQLNNFKGSWGVFFNKKLAKDANLGDVYQVVRDGKWTLDKLKEYGKAIANDVNGDGQMLWGDDVFGVGLEDAMVISLIHAAGDNTVKFNTDGTYEYQANSAHFTESMEQIWNFMNTDNADYLLNANDWSDKISSVWVEFRNLFKADKIGFYMGHLGTVTLVGGDMNSDFGILPMPKVHNDQEDYYSDVQYTNGHVLGIPKSTQNIERTGLLTEAYQMLSYSTVREAYYDYTLTFRAARDNESGEMLDIIFANRNLDLAMIFNSTTKMYTFVQNAGIADNFAYASAVASEMAAHKTNIDKMLDTIKKLDV